MADAPDMDLDPAVIAAPVELNQLLAAALFVANLLLLPVPRILRGAGDLAVKRARAHAVRKDADTRQRLVQQYDPAALTALAEKAPEVAIELLRGVLAPQPSVTGHTIDLRGRDHATTKNSQNS